MDLALFPPSCIFIEYSVEYAAQPMLQNAIQFTVRTTRSLEDDRWLCSIFIPLKLMEYQDWIPSKATLLKFHGNL